MGALPKREVKDIFTGDEARKIVISGVRKGYEAVSSTYGPAANNVLQGMPFGDPVLTRDGVTVAKRTILPWKPEDDAWSIMRQASDETNKNAGDGTTATVVLGFNILDEANKLVVAGHNAMILKKQIEKDARTVITYLESMSQPAGDHLLEVATVSSGDPGIGKLVSDMMRDVGVDGGVTIREQNYPTIDVERINGYYFNRGWNVLNTEVSWEKPLILVSQKQFSSAADIVPLIQSVLTLNPLAPKLVIIGEVGGEAMQILLQNTMAQVDANGKPFPFEALVIPPPAYGDEGKLFMEDIAIYTKAQLFSSGANVKDITKETFGTADKVQLNQDQGILFSGGGSSDAISSRAAEIKTNMDKETNPHAKDQLEQRYSKLVGKVAIVNVGGSTPAEMEELRFRVEDAIEATKSAMADGILPGGGTMLVHAANLTFKAIPGFDPGYQLSPLFRNALESTFKKLMNNAGEPADLRLEQVKEAKFGFGFNLRADTSKPVDLSKAGIWDATRAVTQTVENAASSAGALLTVNTIITQTEDETSDSE